MKFINQLIEGISHVKQFGKRRLDSLKGVYHGTHQEISELEAKLSKSGPNSSTKVELSAVNTRKFRIIGVVCVLGALALYRSAGLVYLIITAFIIAMAVENMILFFQRWFSRGFSITIAYLFFALFVLSGLILVVPFIAAQLIELMSMLVEQIVAWQVNLQNQGLVAAITDSAMPTQIQGRLLEIINNDGWGAEIQSAILSNMNQIVSFGTNSIKNTGSTIVGIITGFFSVAVQAFIVFIMSIFFSLEKKNVIRSIAHISNEQTRTELVLLKVYKKLGAWLQGQLILCFAIGILSALGLGILARFGIDLPNKTTLAIIAGLTEFIPYLGPILGMIPALLIALTQYGFTGFVSVIFVYLIIQQAENNILVPTVMYHTLGASPLLIFICMLVGGSLFGFLGVLLAVPIAVITTILFDTYKKPHIGTSVLE